MNLLLWKGTIVYKKNEEIVDKEKIEWLIKIGE